MQLFHLTKSAVIQIAKTVQARKQVWFENQFEIRHATCRYLAYPVTIGRKFEMQVRMADQAMYYQGNQSVFVEVDSGPCYQPLRDKLKLENKS